MIKPLIPMHRPAREHTVGSHDVSLMAGIDQLFGDKAYRGDPFRKSLHKDHIPPVNRKERAGHDKKPTGVIERCCCRLKVAHIAAHHDKPAASFFPNNPPRRRARHRNMGSLRLDPNQPQGIRFSHSVRKATHSLSLHKAMFVPLLGLFKN
jgi:hypothetical protein